jgi:glyoxylase-like metal-dependent hydrolase (beta-lactamase superfamily II)
VPQTNYQDLPHGITTIDTGYCRPGFDASHLLVEKDQAALVDVGTTFSVPRLLRVLDDKGIAYEAVRYVMVTHVHLDHAGGAGALLHHLPNAQLVVHPRGAPHMIDPAKLIAGATAVYGEERFRALYGDIVPVASERVIEAADNFELSLSGRPLLFLDTPGHARHHYCIYDAASRGIFSGDTFGLSYRDFDSDAGPFVFPTTTPVQFDPEALHASVERLLSFNPERMYLTHYGCIKNPSRLAAQLHDRIDGFTQLARDVDAVGLVRHEALVAGLNRILLCELQAHGCRLTKERVTELLAVDVELNAQGLEIWLDRVSSA